MIARYRGQGLDPGERELLDDVGPLPLGRQLAAALLELFADLIEVLTEIDNVGRELADRLVLGCDDGLGIGYRLRDLRVLRREGGPMLLLEHPPQLRDRPAVLTSPILG